MTERSLARLLLVAGALLLAAGLLFWWLAAPDLSLHHSLLVEPHSAAKRAARRLSNVGGLAAMGPLAIAVACALALRRRGRDALWLAATIIAGRLLMEGLKLIVHRPRPPLGDRLADVSSWSFPSSHSAGSMMTCLAFAIVAGGRWWALLPALAVSGAIGWSRLALGVHWPSDVLAGWGLGQKYVMKGKIRCDQPPQKQGGGEQQRAGDQRDDRGKAPIHAPSCHAQARRQRRARS